MKIYTYLLAMLILISSAAALGVAPSYRTVSFEEEQDLNFRIINDNHEDMKVAVYPKGDLSQYVEFEEEIITVEIDELEKTVPFTLRLPRKLSPGRHELEIFIVETGADEEIAVIKANLGVIHKVILHVPYPGEYIQGLLFIEGVRPNEKTTMTLALSNLGQEDVEDISGTIMIWDNEHNPVTRLTTDTISLASGEKGKITADWTPDVDPGTYFAEAVVEYSDNLLTIEKQFDVGEPLVEIKDIRIAQFKLGTVAKFDIVLQSLWNNEIQEVRTTTTVHDTDANEISSYDASPVALPAMSSKSVPSYWDTENVASDNYIFAVRMKYLGREREKNYEIAVSQDAVEFLDGSFTGHVTGTGSEEFSLVPFAIIGIVAVVLGATIFWVKKMPRPSKTPTTMKHVSSKDIKKYVKYNLSQGISPKALKKKLLKKGYEEEQVDEVILDMEEKI